MSASPITKITALLPVDAIEPVLPFWQAIGFSTTVTVPHGDRLGFAILDNGRSEVMLQTFASIGDDMPALAADVRKGPSFLFVEVSDLDAVERALAGKTAFMPRRETFYGSHEIGYRDPAGHYVTFAHFPDRQE